MKKVGIMTLHIGDNYGALLQCYALRNVINSFSGVQADVINYDPGREYPCYQDQEVQENYLEKLRKFREFNEKFNGIKEPVFFDTDDERMLQYDYYITGSDQVWNTSFSFAKSAYFLDFVPEGAKKIAYAPSIGMPITSPKLRRDWFEKNIPSFDWLSLREISYQGFLGEFTRKDIYSVVDPTLLLTAKDYDELCEGTKHPEGEYILLYFLKHDHKAPLLISLANMLSRKFNLKVVYSFAKVPSCVFKNESETFYYSDPREFVQAVKHAKIVITNSFHGTIFSLLYHRPFFTYLVGSMSSRVMDLLTSVGLEERIVHGYRKLTDDMLDVDFNKADEVIKNRKDDSIKYLKKALDIMNVE